MYATICGIITMIRQRLQDHFPALCRLYAGGDAIVSWYNSISDPGAKLFSIARTQDGNMLLWIMAIAGLAVVADVIINDWTPEFILIGHRRFRLAWQKAFVHRHLLFVTIAFCYAAQPYVAEMGGYRVSLLIFFYWNCFQNLAIAFFDAKLRSRSMGWQRACS
jgi:hypothetical protein